MLNLYRHLGETIIIDGEIRVVLLRVNGRNKHTRRVRLGIVAPEGVAVHRQEVQDRILRGEPPPSENEK